MDDSSEPTEESYSIRGGISSQPPTITAPSKKSVLRVKGVQPNKQDKFCRALIDSGASESIIHKRLTDKENILSAQKRVTWTTRTGNFHTSKKARIDFHFLELNSKQKVSANFHVDEENIPSDGYEMIIGIDLIELIGLNIDGAKRAITWGDFTCYRAPRTEQKQNSTDKQSLQTVDDEAELIPAVKRALNQQGTAMIPSAKPTIKATTAPTVKPTIAITNRPTSTPTARPTSQPTARPTTRPTSGTNSTYHLNAITIIDPSTSWIEITQIPDKEARTTAIMLDRHWFCRYPRPLFCIYDNGNEFLGFEFQEMLESYGVLSKPTT
ncbi:MAG: hypothetical protein ACREOZ_02015, partial [Gloeomargaritales cyanobacterium]